MIVTGAPARKPRSHGCKSERKLASAISITSRAAPAKASTKYSSGPRALTIEWPARQVIATS
jgi:hypothetical protein